MVTIEIAAVHRECIVKLFISDSYQIECHPAGCLVDLEFFAELVVNIKGKMVFCTSMLFVSKSRGYQNELRI